MSSLRLRVAEAATKDVGRALARLDPDDLRRLGLQTGDVIEIRGKSIAVAKALPSHPAHRGHSRIALDGLTRENAQAAIDDLIEVAPAPAAAADRVEIVPLGVEPSRRDLDYIGRLLDGLVVREGARIRATVFGARSAEFRVVRTSPRGNVVLHPITQLHVLPKAGSAAPAAERKLSYEDVGGLGPQLQRIREIIELPLRHPQLFERLGIDPPKGVLLYGPPGTGKTLIARTIAQEASARFFSVSGPEIVHKFYGESEAHLRKIFAEAARQSPSIIFLDEIDSIAPRRERVQGDVEKRIVAQLLALMDGLERRQNTVVIAATNLPDALDPALRRPGRFDREIEIPVPDRPGRAEILEIHSHGMPLHKEVSLASLAARTHGFVGADLQALCREAAMRCLRRLLPDIDLGSAELPYSLIEQLQILPADFEEALAEIEPSALRDAFVEVPNVAWEQVGGLDEVRQRLIEAVEWPLRRPELFAQAAVRPPRALLLTGPPGCGKTLLAKAVATESKVNFLSVKGPELLSKFVGDSERSVRELFRKARRAAPCILFFDEIDAVGPVRGQGQDPVADRVLAQLLTEMDGIEELCGVFVLAATNRVDRLDPALLRPGRFDEIIPIEPPNAAGREAILRIQFRGKPVPSDLDWPRWAALAEGFTGAQLMAVSDRAAFAALRRAWNGEPLWIRPDDLQTAIDSLRAATQQGPS
ncbi:MAG: CDC48 family AAA ATPase [Acidobacteria bacterium]|nr:CDC48 family AAA ATPase [Acidobacteriota bacterium]